MKKFEKLSPIQEIESNILVIFGILRNQNIPSKEYSLILLLLSIYKDGLLGEDILKERNQQKSKLIDHLNSVSDGQYTDILEYFIPSLSRFSENGIGEVFEILRSIDISVLSANFPAIFENVLYRISHYQGRHSGEFIQPVELTRFMCSLAELEPNARVFNPFAGLASFEAYLDQSHKYVGQERNNKTWALGALRLMAYNKHTNSEYTREDSILNWPDPSEKFDLIISSPPFGIKISHHSIDSAYWGASYEHFLLKKGIQSLTKNGKLVVLLPNGFSFKPGKDEIKLRKELIESDLIDLTIISLPNGLLKHTGIPLIILLLSKAERIGARVKFVDANTFVVANGTREKVLNDSKLLNFIQCNSEDNNFIRFIDKEQIRKNDYNLNIARYNLKPINGIELSDILKEIKHDIYQLPKKGKLVQASDLKDDKVDFRLDTSRIDETELTHRSIKPISKSCLLINIRYLTLRPTLFEFKGESIFISNGILAFSIDETRVDLAYLTNELHSEYVQEQLRSYQSGDLLIPSINPNDFKKVIIKLPSLEEQRAKINGILELSNEIRILQNKLNSKLKGESELDYEKTSSLKHSLGTPLMNIGSSLRNIENALSKKYDTWKVSKLNERNNITLGEAFDSVRQNLKTIHNILIANEHEIDFSNKKLEEIDFLAFIKGYFKNLKVAEKSNVSTKLDIHPDIKEKSFKEGSVFANVELLEIGLNAIVENAFKHAFVDDSKKYKLEFRISLYFAPSLMVNNNEIVSSYGTFVKIEIANNGKEFPKNYSFEKLIRKNSFAGETGNTGQGGFDLNEIIKHHNQGKSTLELVINDSKAEFTTTYSFLIPFNK